MQGKENAAMMMIQQFQDRWPSLSLIHDCLPNIAQQIMDASLMLSTICFRLNDMLRAESFCKDVMKGRRRLDGRESTGYANSVALMV
jgi:hypothetical protein